MNNPYISLLTTAWRYSRQHKKRYLLVYAMFILANPVLAAHPILYGWFIQSIQNDPSGLLDNVWLYGSCYLALTLTEWALHGPSRVMERKLAFDLSKNFLDEMYHQALHLPMRWHQEHHSGATINRIRKAYEALSEFFQNGFMFLHAFAKFVFSLIAIVWFSPIFGIISVLIGIINIWVIFRFDKPFIKALNEANEREHVVSSTLFDSLSNIITVITLRLEKRMKISLLSKVDDVFPPFVRSVTINEWKWFVASMFIALIYVVVTTGYVYQNYIPGQVFLVGGLVTLLSYVNQFTSVFQDIAWQYTEIIRYNTEVQTALSISETFRQLNRSHGSEGLPEDWREITIHDLNVSHGDVYDREKRAHTLHGINICIKKGCKIAFIGESGSGKSTLLALLRGLYDPAIGVNVLVDSQLSSNMQLLADEITLFPQDPEIFENTIDYNITLGLPFDENEILDACNIAYFMDVIQKLPSGLHSNIQEKGVNLSGGQKQRLALARGILAARNSEIVLLDEPTSSVDPKTESLIYERMFEKFKDKAVISTLHRLHLLVKFDYIYILRDGYVVDEGSFSELHNKSAIFRDMWQHQLVAGS